MTVYFRLLAGFTSFISKRCLSHFCSIGPAGTFVPGDVYANAIAGFHVPWVAAFYLLAMIALGLHLYHGAWASIRTLGHAKPSDHPLKRRIALGVAAVVWLGFTLVPLGVIAGIIR